MTPLLVVSFKLLIIFQIKHLVADFFLQNKYMLEKSNNDWSFVLPLLTHSLVNGILSGIIVLLVFPRQYELAFTIIFIDTISHFFIDRLKSGPRWLGRFKNKENPMFWYCLGFDQVLHQLVYLYIVWQIIPYIPF